ncbi:MAG: hypothetical protein FWE45_01690 [Firmicutes bacterium]|nr:hypothetical protein [Bacillota bacterium]
MDKKKILVGAGMIGAGVGLYAFGGMQLEAANQLNALRTAIDLCECGTLDQVDLNLLARFQLVEDVWQDKIGGVISKVGGGLLGLGGLGTAGKGLIEK